MSMRPASLPLCCHHWPCYVECKSQCRYIRALKQAGIAFLADGGVRAETVPLKLFSRILDGAASVAYAATSCGPR
jgi:hypothetical protein